MAESKPYSGQIRDGEVVTIVVVQGGAVQERRYTRPGNKLGFPEDADGREGDVRGGGWRGHTHDSADLDTLTARVTANEAAIKAIQDAMKAAGTL